MAETLISRLEGDRVQRLLVAPCGTGIDYPYIKDLSEEVHGIDIAEAAVSLCPEEMNAQVADILDAGFPDQHFDVIVSPLFFHHMREFGFARFLNEFNRMLKPGGLLVILEPSLWYPLNIVSRQIKRFGNPYDEVEDEGPFSPGLMLKELKSSGYAKIDWRAATFCHPAFPVAFSRVFHNMMAPLSRSPLVKLFSWMIVYHAVKRDNQ